MLLSIAERFGDGAAAYTLRDRLDHASIAIADIDRGGQDAMEFSHALIYFSPLGSRADRAALPLDSAYPAKKLAFLRSSWTDANATFIGQSHGLRASHQVCCRASPPPPPCGPRTASPPSPPNASRHEGEQLQLQPR